MKKFLAVVMTAVLAMSMMTACGSSKSSEENKDTTAAKRRHDECFLQLLTTQ